MFRRISRRVALGVGLGLMLATSFPSGAVASAERVEFEGLFYTCSTGGPTEEWVSGDVLHLRGLTNHNLWVTGNPLIDGFADNVVDADINLKTGTGVAHPRETLNPDAVDGTWEIQTTVLINPDGLASHGVGRGTGDLHGMSIEVRGELVFVGPDGNPCSDIPFAVQLAGSILVPASAT